MDATKAVSANFAATANVRVLSPNGKEIFKAGDFVTITWVAPPAATKFNLQYSLNNGATWQTIVTGVPAIATTGGCRHSANRRVDLSR
jgi:hypothetical protein